MISGCGAFSSSYELNYIIVIRAHELGLISRVRELRLLDL